MLTCLNLKNGNNQLINSIKTSENYSLLCVDVDDSAYSTNNPIWKNGVDNWTKFSEDCRSSCTNTGIQKNTFEQSIIVYPNPNLGSFSIEVSFKKPSDISIFITNTLGEVVYTDFESNISKQNISINLDLADGLYYVRVLTVEGIELFPIIVAK
ncbi:T9SS type A sorting domain-containing protein [Candidatus Woesearchaeota archaeon]|nr:T9SS type A sorting domain-containing protein [Candidatus Woesearchaeota archaeon]